MSEMYDILVIGGGVNGVATARDAQGRGLKTALVEKSDLAAETSSKSTKLFHGGLRYLEYLEINLVRHSLIEREVLWKNMPHIAWPMRFILPIHPEMRFTNTTPVGKILGFCMPWLKGRRPRWVIGLGLWFYSRLGAGNLPKAARVDLMDTPSGDCLKPAYHQAFEYSDVWVHDSRLVSLMARDAKERGADIFTHNPVIGLTRHAEDWAVTLSDRTLRAKKIVNAAGPWVEQVLRKAEGITSDKKVRLVKGSHIVVPKLYDHPQPYLFQGADGRVIFTLPYEIDYTLIGTTEVAHDPQDGAAECSDEEAEYLCQMVSQYLATPVSPDQVVWSFSGARPLVEDGAENMSASSRDYVLKHDTDGAELLSIYGGKITTHRKLAEDALAMLGYKNLWTADAPLAGGNFIATQRDTLIEKLHEDFPTLERKHAERVFAHYGTECWTIFANDWGVDFGHGLYGCEVDHLIMHEFVMTAEDILWRRTKLGLELNETEVEKLERYVTEKTNT